jgi:hypothetical protein
LQDEPLVEDRAASSSVRHDFAEYGSQSSGDNHLSRTCLIKETKRMHEPLPALVPIHGPSRTVRAGELAEALPAAERQDGSFQSNAMWAPVFAAMLLDLADLFSLGPQGLLIGLFVGSALGWRIASTSGFSRKGRLICAALAAVYCMLPMTELLPLATMLTTASRVVSALSLLRRFRP